MKQVSTLKKLATFTILLFLFLGFSACTTSDVAPTPTPPPIIEATQSPVPQTPAPTPVPAPPAANTATREDVLFALTHPDLWQIIDVRTHEEWAGEVVSASGGAYGMGRIAGALHLDWLLLRNMPAGERLAHIEDMLDGRDLILYCHSGARAGQAMEAFETLGVTVLNYTGSWINWSFAVSIAGENDTTLHDFTEMWTDFKGIAP